MQSVHAPVPCSGPSVKTNKVHLSQLIPMASFIIVFPGFQESCSIVIGGCTVEFYYDTMDTDAIVIENSDDYSCPASVVPWIIAGTLVGILLLLAVLALALLKACLFFRVS